MRKEIVQSLQVENLGKVIEKVATLRKNAQNEKKYSHVHLPTKLKKFCQMANRMKFRWKIALDFAAAFAPPAIQTVFMSSQMKINLFFFHFTLQCAPTAATMEDPAGEIKEGKIRKTAIVIRQIFKVSSIFLFLPVHDSIPSF